MCQATKDSVSRAQVIRWRTDFVNVRESVGDEPRSGRTTSVSTNTDVECVGAFIRQYRRLTIRMIADGLNINECTFHQILTRDLKMRKLDANIVPNNLNDDKKSRRNEEPAEMLERLET